MAEQRKVVDSKLSKMEAYQKCFRRASQLGLNVKANIPGERLEIVKGVRGGLWWTCVVLGTCLYIVPGVLVGFLWKPVEYCKLIFDENGTGSTVTAEVKGESGNQFFNDVSGMLI